jgi:hypothetical protein
MSSIDALARPVRQHLTVTADEACRASGCVQRTRQFSGATLIQTLVLGFLQAPDATLSQLCQLAAARGVAISPQGLAQRFTPELVSALEQVLEAIVGEVVAGPAVDIALLRRFRRVWLLDTTVISLPAELAEVWAGCGGHAGQGQAALKVAVELDLVTGQLHGPRLQAGRAPDRTSALVAAPHAPGELTVRDLGFFSLPQARAMQARGEHWLSRLMAGTIVFHDGRRWSQVEVLRAQPGPVVDLAVELGARERLPARLLAVAVPAAVAAQRRARLRDEARKKGQPVSAERLELAGWTVLVTDLPPAQLRHVEAQALLRARWQIEQLFDLWKTGGGLARSRSRQPWRMLAEIYAKLIALVIQHWLLLHGDWQAPNHSLGKAAQVVRDSVRLLAHALDRVGRLRLALREIRQVLACAGRLNTRRTKPNTCQILLDPDSCLT